MVQLLGKFLLQAFALLAITYLVPGFQVDGLTTAVVMVFVLGIVNLVVRPVLVLLTLPITIVTLGLFTFVINFVLFWFVSSFIKGVAFEPFSALLFAWFLYSVFGIVIDALFKSQTPGDL